MALELPDIQQKAQDQGKEALKDVLFGSLAGIAGKYIEYPFDTVKVRLQSQPDGIPLQYKGPIDCFRQSFKAEGVRWLYRGISAPLFGAAVETSSLFFSYRVTQEILQSTIYSPSEKLPFSALITCGAVSGAFTSLLLTPIELIKCKMQVPRMTEAGLRPPGPLALIVSVFKHDGLLGFWRGQMGTLIRETGGSAAWFGGYEGVSALFRKYNAQNSPVGSSDMPKPLPLYQQMLSGAAAGVSYNFIFYPADTIKSRIQTEDIAALTDNARRKTFWEVGRSLWRQQGVTGLYRGCGITCARSAPSSAFIFSIYEGLRYYFG
ncbi:mitochondrial ornithine carrier protein [Ophidiomyces ophidiicola]|nr:mitochondrial ornithine carrier protein [Ophidiomyces ophidiicola]KAI1941851.1 mitochondrial ornithine carrier protein [Ophidiomyces ophidiicola]